MAGSDSLENKQISSTYKDLLQVPNANSGVDGTVRTVMDGEGTESALQVSTAGVKSTGTLESTGNLTVGGSLTLGSTEVTSSATELNLLDGLTAVDTDLSSVSSSDDTLASAKSIKTYVDSQVQSKDDLSELSGTLDDIAAGTTNKHFTATDETKLDGIETGAEVNVNADWDATSGDAQILNKPSTFSPSSHTHAISEVTNLQSSLDAKQATVTAGDGLSFSGSTLNAEVTQTELDAKIANVSEDTTPELGGPLNTNGQDIVSTSNTDIEIAPDGTGKTVFKGNTNAGKITLNCENNSHGVSLASPAHADYSGNWTLTLPTSAGSNGQVLTTNGSGVASWATRSSVSDLNDLSDVNAGSPSDGQVLKWNDSASEWQAMADNNSGGSGGGGTPAGSTGQIQFNSGGSFGADSNLVWDDTNDRLGIGVSSPSERLHISGAGTQRLLVEETGSTVKTKLLSSTTAGVLATATDHPLGFDTNDQRRMTLTSTGLGIGTTNPSSKLDCQGNARFENSSSNLQVDFVANNSTILNFTNGTSEGTILRSDEYLRFDTGGATERMRIASDGAITGGGLKFYGGILGHKDSDASSITLVGGSSSANTGANITLGGTSGSATREVIFKSNSTETMRIDSDGRVHVRLYNQYMQNDGTTVAGLIGNASKVNGNTDTDLALYSVGGIELSTGGSSSPKMTIDSSGNLGVGSQNPSGKLEVNTGSGIAYFTRTAGDDGSTNPALGIAADSTKPLIRAYGDGLVFETAAVGGTASERLRIDSSGNIGIGTASPSEKLSVSSGNIVIDNGQAYRSKNTSGVTRTLLNLYTDNKLYVQSPSETVFQTNTDSSTVNAMTIRSNGDVGIGTTAPSCELHVKTATTSGITNTSKVGIQTEDSRGGGAIFGGTDMNHAILFRYGRDDTVNVLDYHAYGIHRFYTNSSVQSQVERMRIDSNGRVTVKKSSNAEVTALTDGATITPDFNDANNFSVTLGGNRTLANPSNCTAGQSGIITITQDGTGSRTLAYGSYWKFSGGTAPTLTTTASAVDVLAYYVESATRITATLITDTK